MIKTMLALMLCIGLSACATTQFNSAVNGFADPGFVPNARHIIMPSTEMQKGDLQFAETSAELGRAMVANGLTMAAPGEKPDVAVFVEYGIGSPRTITSVISIPVWGQTGVASATTTATATSYGATTNVQATTTYTPTYGVVGQNNVPVSQTIFDRFITIRAYDVAAYAKTQQMHELWQMQVRSSGVSGDLRYVLPYMLRAAQPYLGRSTGRAIDASYLQDDPQVEFIRTGVTPTKKR